MANITGNIATGKVDITIQFMTVTPGRAQQVAFTRPYYIEGIALLTKPGSPMQEFSALEAGGANTKVSILQNVDAEHSVHSVLPQAEVLQIDTQANVVQALEAGRVDAAAVDLSTVAWMTKRDPDKYADSGKQDPHRPAGLLTSNQFAERSERNSHPLGLWVLTSDSRADGVEIGLRRFWSHTRRQPAQHSVFKAVAVRIRTIYKRNKDVGEIQYRFTRRQDARDPIGLIVKAQGCANDREIG